MLRFDLARCSIVSKLPDTSKVKARLTADFHRNVFAAVIQSFEQYDNPLRVNNFATGLRELTRLVLDYSAPEKSIKACAWYVEEKNEQGKLIITRAQRIKYAVQAGLPDDFVASLLVDVPETIRVFGDLTKRMNKLTHLTQETFGIDRYAAVDCTLQYGSDSDVANDSGMRVYDNYPLTCEFVADVLTPMVLEVRKLHVDNSSFYE